MRNVWMMPLVLATAAAGCAKDSVAKTGPEASVAAAPSVTPASPVASRKDAATTAQSAPVARAARVAALADGGEQDKLCACFKKTTDASTCDDMQGAADPDCERTYGDDCESLLECSRGEPGRAPRCLSGFVNVAPTGRCAKTCVTGKDCATGETCQPDIAARPVCVAP